MDPQVYKAAKLGDITFLEQLEDSSLLLRVTPNKNTALHVSVRFGHTEFVKKVYSALLQHNTSLEGDTEYSRNLSLLTQVNSDDDTALHVAAREGHLSIAKFLIEKIKPWPSDLEGAYCSSLASEKIRIRNKSKNTALHEAVRRKELEMVKLLTEADHDLGHLNYDADEEGCGESPLYLAARDGCLGILNQIFCICSSPALGGPHGRTALHVAVVERRLDVVKILLEKMGENRKVLLNKADKNGRTALHYAIPDVAFQQITWVLRGRNKPSDNLKIVQELLRHDTSSAYKSDKNGLSPLHIAALESSIQVFQELIQCCPDSGELLDNKRRNVLHFAVMSKNCKKISFALKQPELQELVNKADDDGNTPFHLVAKLGCVWHGRLFRSNARVDVKAMNNKGQTATENFLFIPGKNTIFSWIQQLYIAIAWLPWNALGVRGEKKWMIGVNKEPMQIRSDHNKQEEEEEEEEEEQLGGDDQSKPGEVAATTRKSTQSQKATAEILQIVASLIASVAFTAVFQVPGGYNSNNGRPILQDNGHFQNFIIYNTAAMDMSICTLMVMFLGPLLRGQPLDSSSLVICTVLVCIAILFTEGAFSEGLDAVSPRCGGRASFLSRLFYDGLSTQTFTNIGTNTLTNTVGLATGVWLAYLFYRRFLFKL